MKIIFLICLLGLIQFPGLTQMESGDSVLARQTGDYVKSLAGQDRFSGSVLIAHNGKIIYQAAYGKASKEYEVEVDNNINTAFNLASMTKMFTGVAIAQLAQEGKLSFGDPVKKYLPDLPKTLTEGISVHHLLTHTSGLGSFWTDEFHNSNHAAFRTLNDYVKLIGDQSPQFKPGSKWAYSNTGYLLLGLIIEKISGLSYFEYVKKNVFEKVGMKGDFYEADLPVRGLATSYSRYNRYVNDTTRWSLPLFIAPVKGSPAGGAYASAIDLFQFAEALLGNKLLNQQFTKEIITGKAAYGRPEQQKKYAYGFANQVENGKLIVFHDGAANGISTELDIYPGSGYTVIVLSNYDHPASWNIIKLTRELITR
jgi:CubicO group peptidase (beta-lactamase class C family)